MEQQFADILGMGMPEMIVVLVIVLLLFGSKKLPELSRSIGSSIRELRKSASETDGSGSGNGPANPRP